MTFAQGMQQFAEQVTRDRAAGIDPFAGPPAPLSDRRAKLKARRRAAAHRRLEQELGRSLPQDASPLFKLVAGISNPNK